MQKLIHVEEKEVALPLGLSLGHPNDMPTPFRECSTDEYWHRHSIPQAMLYRQIYLKGWATVRSVYIEVYSDYCLAVAAPANWQVPRPKKEGDYDIHWTEPPLYYYLGCDHKFVELSSEESLKRGIRHSGACFHVHECTMCKAIRAVDSDG